MTLYSSMLPHNRCATFISLLFCGTSNSYGMSTKCSSKTPPTHPFLTFCPQVCHQRRNVRWWWKFLRCEALWKYLTFCLPALTGGWGFPGSFSVLKMWMIGSVMYHFTSPQQAQSYRSSWPSGQKPSESQESLHSLTNFFGLRYNYSTHRLLILQHSKNVMLYYVSWSSDIA